MTRHSFIQMSKLSNVKGRISYVTSPARQENLYATYHTADAAFWTSLARENQQEFKRSGTEGTCIEAREFIIALPEKFTRYDPQRVLAKFTEEFQRRYNVECVSGLHHNKAKTNYHIHLIFSERRLLPEPVVKVATRSMFYDETGKQVEIHEKVRQSIHQDGWFPHLFRAIVGKAKDFLQGVIRQRAIPPKPTLDIDMTEFQAMRGLMIKVQDEAKGIRYLQEDVLSDLKQQLAAATGIFRVKERKDIAGQIQRTEQEIGHRLDALPSIVQTEGYPDVQTFTATYRKAEAVVSQYNREMAEWERKAQECQRPAVKERPPESKSVRERLRRLQDEGKRQQPQPRRRAVDRDSR